MKRTVNTLYVGVFGVVDADANTDGMLGKQAPLFTFLAHQPDIVRTEYFASYFFRVLIPAELHKFSIILMPSAPKNHFNLAQVSIVGGCRRGCVPGPPATAAPRS